MKVLDELLPGACLLAPFQARDDRGEFVKTFHRDSFADLHIDFSPAEEFFSVSRRNVVRGMHCQLPPYEHAKLVYCVRGSVLDVILDLRRESPTYAQSASVRLSEDERNLLFIPAGFAHGFLALDSDCIMVYLTSRVHAPTHDSGVRWDSFGFDWKVSDPVISPRDANLPRLADFVSPF